MSIRIWQWALWVLISESWYHSPLGAIAPKIDPADAYGDLGASVPNVSVGGEDRPVAEMAFRGARPDTATDDDDASADINFFAAVTTSLAVEVVHRARIRRGAGRVREGKEIVDHVDHHGASNTSISHFKHMPLSKRAHVVRAAHVVRGHATSPLSGPPTGYYYYTGGANTYIQNPGGGPSPAGVGAEHNGAPAGYYSKAGATAYLEDPAGTYSPAGATAPIADPGGTYSAAGASAPTTDPAGTYSSPYALTRLFLDPNPTTPATGVLSFNSAAAVADYYGAGSFEAGIANEFFAGYGDTPATMLFTRYSAGGGRPHLYGANISNLTRKELQNISGSLSITFQSLSIPFQQYTYSVGSIDLSQVHSFWDAAKTIQRDLNTDLHVAAQTSGSTIKPYSVSFTGSISGDDLLQITSVSSGGSIELGAEISGPGGIPIGQIVTQRTGTPGGPGLYTLFAKAPPVSSETMTESYGVLTVGSVDSGAVGVGQRIIGAGVQSANPITAIDGPGPLPGTWLVNNAQAVGPEDMTMAATPLVVNYNSFGGATTKRNFFEIQPNGAFGYDNNSSTLSYMDGTAAAALGLTQASGALDSSPGGAAQSASVFMNNLVQNEYSQFGSFQATWETLAELDPRYLNDLAAWAQSTGDLYTFLSQSTNTTPPAGSSLPTTDPAGTYSGPGASAPTIDPAGTYSGPGASAPTPQPGYYASTAGASSETRDDPGYYTPYPGATEEIKLPAANLLGSAGVTDRTQIAWGRGNSLIDQNYAGARLAPSYFDDNIPSGLLLLSPSAAAALKIGVTAPTGSGLYGGFALEGAEARGERLLLGHLQHMYAHHI
jgi:hypothetical protein